MNFFKKYNEFVGNNPEGYWFKRKWYGWGWTPVTWQGWAVIGAFLAVILIDSFMLDPNPSAIQLTLFFVKLFLTVAVLIGICYKTGQKPRWQWGKELEND